MIVSVTSIKNQVTDLEFSDSLETIKIQDIIDKINSLYKDQNKQVVKIIINHEMVKNYQSTLSDIKWIENQTSIYYVTQKITPQAPKEAQASQEDLELNVKSEIDHSTQFITAMPQTTEDQVPEKKEPVVKIYDGKTVLSAANKNGDIMYNIICDIASRNPFFLSYLAVNPGLARKEMNKILNSDEFKLTIHCQSELDDPILATNMHPSGDNGYQIDKRNVEFLMTQANGISDFDQAMELYLWCDRDIQRTLQALGGQ
jgi:hypothetical protein